MAQLGRFRTGWENEHLASFLLSRVAFVANPITVADDVGSDFLCTLFEVVEVDSLLPRSSFAIQIKSSRTRIDAKKQIEYFERLELPFFVGVIDQRSLKLSIYSGEYLPFLFSHFGRPQGLTLSPEDNQISLDNYYEKKPDGSYILRMPHVLDLEAEEDSSNIVNKGQVLVQLCSRMHQNISSKISCEYLFKLGDGRPVIYAGPGSAQTFRDNFYNRLAEVFRNLAWLTQNHPDQFSIAEYRLFERCYLELKSRGAIPMILTAAYEALRVQIPANAQQD